MILILYLLLPLLLPPLLLADDKFLRMLRTFNFIKESQISECEDELHEWNTKLLETLGKYVCMYVL